MKRAVVCLGLLLFAGQSSGFSVKLTGTAKIGESKGKGKYWKPGGGVGFGQGHMAMTVKTSSKGNENKVVFTVNGGDNFQEYQGDEAFCGLKSFVIEDKNTRVCPDESQQAPDDDSIKMPVVEWSISAGGIMSSSSMEAKRPEAKLTVWTQAIKRETPRKVRFGDNLLDMKDKKLMFRLAEITFPPAEDEDEEDDSVHNVILKSQDGGYSWFYLGTLPIELGKENTLERQGENGFIVYTKANNTIFSVASKTLGRKWGNATEVSHFQNLPSYLNTRFTSIMAGGRGTPSLAAIGGKKGSEKFFNLARHHNDMLEDAHDYPEGFLKATEKESNAECEKGADEEKCASSGHVSISSFGEDPDNKNLTKIMMCYDKVAGWDSEDQDAIYCMKGHVNETTELVAHEAKMKKREEKKKQEQEARERAQKYAEEQRQRKKQEKREKDRKVRMQRQEWAKIDNEVYIVPAKVDYLEDGDFVVVRDLGKHAMYADFMEETVGLPNKEDLTKEAESEAAEEEK
eukprot:TRINITY_DN14788_c0_g1_i2.p1 TRINITY_DN14788_c0_g1~~TRINITY_DN14788_c0_g1_i2.p1  ORF type:complete len:514 (+),score=157.61 TRINITY_DN14788_c0_g1_i2:40-1581(+)